MAAVLAGGLAGSLFVEPGQTRIAEMEIRLTRLGREWDGLRIVQLSDFHNVGSRDGRLIQKAVQAANGLAPDLIVLTGDFVTFYQGRQRYLSVRHFPVQRFSVIYKCHWAYLLCSAITTNALQRL